MRLVVLIDKPPGRAYSRALNYAGYLNYRVMHNSQRASFFDHIRSSRSSNSSSTYAGTSRGRTASPCTSSRTASCTRYTSTPCRAPSCCWHARARRSMCGELARRSGRSWWILNKAGVRSSDLVVSSPSSSRDVYTHIQESGINIPA